MLNPKDLGYIIEGIIEQDPMDDRYRIRTVMDGKQVLIDPQDLLAKYNGEEVKLTLASLENIRRLQEVLEENHGGGQITALMPEEVPGAEVKTSRKPD